MPYLRHPLHAIVVLSAMLSVVPASAQTDAERTRMLEGAWRFVETTNPRTLAVIDNQPGYRLFVDGHFAWVRVNGLRPRPQPTSTSTTDLLRSVYVAGFLAQAGTYEVRGDTMISRPIVHRDPAAMAEGNYQVWFVRLDGTDTLYVSLIANQAGPVDNVITGMYVREEAPPAMPDN